MQCVVCCSSAHCAELPAGVWRLVLQSPYRGAALANALRHRNTHFGNHSLTGTILPKNPAHPCCTQMFSPWRSRDHLCCSALTFSFRHSTVWLDVYVYIWVCDGYDCHFQGVIFLESGFSFIFRQVGKKCFPIQQLGKMWFFFFLCAVFVTLSFTL